MYNYNKKQKGQVLIAGMALFIVAASVFFLIFNSNRAVNEKMQLVNAADAAAYSGALTAARQLNFMAYTNRTMIANEVAIGHMVSFQTEVNMAHDTVTSGLTGLGGGLIDIILDALKLKGVMDYWREGMEVVGGAYILTVDATNSMYSDFQKDEYDILTGTGGKSSIIEHAMGQVAQRYVKNDSVSILVNDEAELNELASNSSDAAKSKAKHALENNDFCSLVMFAAPGDSADNASEKENKGKAINAYCKSSGNAKPKGSRDNPVADSGELVTLLNRSAETAPSSAWITDRNKDYEWLLGVDVSKKGATAASWDSSNKRYNWSSGSYNAAGEWVPGDDTIKGGDFIIGVDGKGSSDAVKIGQFFASNPVGGIVGGAVSFLMNTLGMCKDGLDCDAIKNGEYKGIQSYSMINPAWSEAKVTAVLSQKGNCNDLLGRDNDTKQALSGWNDDQARYGSNCDAQGLTAISQAVVLYQRPGCEGAGCKGYDLTHVNTEKPNLFNPFWTAKLVN
ncbi:hypothetical protein A9Q81_24480 [Gammaproteobacteria bacterium 42_54_T18]|nr:hypothetical protein A9Q81_24480 [Gammaproteobacteria bacterium 42_54_T18]